MMLLWCHIFFISAGHEIKRMERGFLKISNQRNPDDIKHIQKRFRQFLTSLLVRSLSNERHSRDKKSSSQISIDTSKRSLPSESQTTSTLEKGEAESESQEKQGKSSRSTKNPEQSSEDSAIHPVSPTGHFRKSPTPVPSNRNILIVVSCVFSCLCNL